VLHTWGQRLNFHPHLHCIVPGGALSADGSRWGAPRQSRFLLPVRALARGGLAPAGVPSPLAGGALRPYGQRWHLPVQPPFGGPEQVPAYLAHYTHRVALSNRRLVALDPVRRTVSFTWRDYRHGAAVQRLTLSAEQFSGRFSWHILPAGLVRIRHYGILGNNRRHRAIPRARARIAEQARRRTPTAVPAPAAAPAPEVAESPAGSPAPTAATTPASASAPAARVCPHCGRLKVRWIGFLDARGCWHFPRAARLDSS
jgi:hypothetical protein